MTINSMTGFAREAGATGPYQWAWEIKTVNGRGLDVRLRTPPGYDAVGEDARQQILKALSRGSCQLNLTVTRAATTPRARVNEGVLAALVEALGRLKLPESVRPASVDGLLAVRGVVEFDDEADDPALAAVLAGDLRAAIGGMIEALQETRQAEGRALAGVVEGHLSTLERLVAAAEASPGRQPDAIRARLETQVAALIGAAPSLDPGRLHQEAALLATRADIREELDRLSAHVEAARALLREGGTVGRRLDFLAQEFGREANTLCAKANDVALSRIGLDLKAAVEQFREQIQNVE
jgi:uncharacterized protein (TIGR00255 family)